MDADSYKNYALSRSTGQGAFTACVVFTCRRHLEFFECLIEIFLRTFSDSRSKGRTCATLDSVCFITFYEVKSLDLPEVDLTSFRVEFLSD